MKRIIYLICQKRFWNKGKPEVLSDGKGKLLYVFDSNKGKRRAEALVRKLNKDYGKQQVHLRKAEIVIKGEEK